MKTEIFKRGTIIADKQYTVVSFIGHYDFSSLYRIVDAQNQYYLMRLIDPQLEIDLEALNRQFTLQQNQQNMELMHYSKMDCFVLNEQTYYFLLSENHKIEPLDKVKKRGMNAKQKTIFCRNLSLFLINLMIEKASLLSHTILSIKMDDLFLRNESFILSTLRIEDYLSSESLMKIKPSCYFYRSNETLNHKKTAYNLYFSISQLIYHCLTEQWMWDYSSLTQSDYVLFRRELISLRLFSEPFLLSKYDADDHFYFQHLIDELMKPTGIDEDKLVELVDYLSDQEESNQKRTGFNKIAGQEDLKNLLNQDVIEPLKNREKYKEYGIALINGILFYGPPGCGKTFIAKALAEEIDYYFMDIKPSDLGSIYVHGGQEKIAELFNEAEKNNPTLIFIDEIDAILRDRETETHSSMAGEVNEFLAQMTNCGERGIVIIGATNYPQVLDKAILRTGRFDKKIFIAPPDEVARMKLFEMQLKERPTENIDTKLLAQLTEGYVASDINHIVNEASKMALFQDKKIEMSDFKAAMALFEPSLTAFQLNQYSNQF